MRKKIIISFLLGCTLIFSITGCSSNNEPALTIKKIDNGFDKTMYQLRDPETGVNYFFYHDGYGGGLSPRYNADGTLYVD